jgi:hypothetical protein
LSYPPRYETQFWFFYTNCAIKVAIKVVSKILNRKERNRAFEKLSLRRNKKKLADLRASAQYAQL